MSAKVVLNMQNIRSILKRPVEHDGESWGCAHGLSHVVFCRGKHSEKSPWRPVIDVVAKDQKKIGPRRAFGDHKNSEVGGRKGVVPDEKSL